MASNINSALPGSGLAYTADIRNNFAAAKFEIEDLQAQVAAFPAVDKAFLSAADIVSVYVYDTRLDDQLPDGGRWNYPGRCSHTSWWHEPLGTATRGAKRDFPVVALIVAQQYRVTIYDALDLDPATGVPRMWMVFNIIFPFKGWAPVTGLCARNGRLYRTANTGTAGDLYITDFANDLHYYWGSGGKTVPNNPRVADRNLAGSSQTVTGQGLVSGKCTAVHARVMPGAPRDAAGLPIPTVAVATAGGVSVIHGSGQVATLTGLVNCTSLCITPRPAVMIEDVGGDLLEVALPYASGSASVLQRFGPGRTTYGGLPLNLSVNSAYKVADTAVGGRNGGGVTFLDKNYARDADGMVAYATSTYATGWMPGDIRLAALCDAATGSITGSGDLITNGDFAGGTAGWTAVNGASLSVMSGRLRCMSSGTANAGAYQVLPTVAGRTYLLKIDVDASGYAGAVASIQVRQDGYLGLLLAESYVSAGGASGRLVQFTATSMTTAVWVFVQQSAAGAYVEFDNISCNLACADRSYKGKGLAVQGTLQRQPVAPGADLVAWSGFSTDNYLWQPYNPDHDYGTGDFCVAFWAFKTAVVEEYAVLRAAYSAGAYSGAGWGVDIFPGGEVAFIVSTDGFASFDRAMSAAGPVAAGSGWHMVVACRRGAALEVWVDGQRQATAAVSLASGSLNNAAATLFVGRAHSGMPSTSTSLRGGRIGAGAPTPAQIRRMYEDGRPLFAEGAKCLLGGSSSVVTSLDHDPLTGRLAVGTGDGVSVFKGLRRVSYYDADVLAAITSDNIGSVSLRGDSLLIGTAVEAGVVQDAIGSKEAALTPMPQIAPAPFVARGVTTDATPTDLAPRVTVGERELVVITATVLGRVYGAADGQRSKYVRRGTFYRDAGGNVTLQGSIEAIGTDQEVTTSADATLNLDTTAQTISVRVTGAASTRISWLADVHVHRISEDLAYA